MPELPKTFKSTLYNAGAIIYSGVLPIPVENQPKAERAFESFRMTMEELVTTKTPPVPREDAGGAGPTRVRTRTNTTTKIAALLTTAGITGMTIAAIAKGLNSTTEKMLPVMTKGVADGKYLKEGSRYRLVAPVTTTQPTGAIAPTGTAPPGTAPTSPGPGLADRVYNWIFANPNCTNPILYAAFPDVWPNHMGGALSRLRKEVPPRINGTSPGPYWVTAAQTQPTIDRLTA